MNDLVEYQERFEEFLKTSSDDDGNLVYFEVIKNMSIKEEVSISIDFYDLRRFDYNFEIIAAENAHEFLEMLHRGLVEVLQSEYPEYVYRTGKSKFKVRIINYFEHVFLKEIRSKHFCKLVHISGNISEIGEIKSVLVHGLFRCTICGQEIRQSQYRTKEKYVGSNLYPVYLEPNRCPLCERKTPVQLIPEKSEFTSWQKIRVQETTNNVRQEQQTKSIDVVLEGDIADTFAVGDYARITGILIPAPDNTPKRGKLTTFGAYLLANSVERQIEDSKELESSELEHIALQVYENNRSNNYRTIVKIAPFAVEGRKYELGRYTFEEVYGHEQMIVKLDGELHAIITDGEYDLF